MVLHGKGIVEHESSVGEGAAESKSLQSSISLEGGEEAMHPEPDGQVISFVENLETAAAGDENENMAKLVLPELSGSCPDFPNKSEAWGFITNYSHAGCAPSNSGAVIHLQCVECVLIADSSVKLPDKLKKHQVLELAFTMYPPLGARLDNRSIRLSTWRKPVVEGEEGQKYILYKHPILKKADIQVVGDLIAKSFLEREQSKV
ncbi:hypothetical protein chiPu_0013821 [Chiloscyllium punctatum]|uniref:Uncharacterized protein n=1 Tax=Chiloscyllium punctatum TaxID=137246 RepID=A0A401SY53_CHIPU|nr:hypothetical protein [Chiloscyllium punctatum]